MQEAEVELQDSRYFLAISRLGSFTKAAEACNVTQPVMTRAIHKLEDELGGLLLSRERGNVHLTDLGRLLEPALAEMLACREKVKRAAVRFVRLEGAQLTLGVMCTIGPLRFVNFLKRFQLTCPGIKLTVIGGVPDYLFGLLLGGDLDVAIMAHPNGFHDPLRGTQLYDEHFMVACAQAHDFTCRKGIRMQDMAGQIYLQRSNCEYRDQLAEILREQGIETPPSHRSEWEDWIQSMVVAGMGVCFLPEFSATLPGIALLPVMDLAVRRQVCIVTVAGRRWPSPVGALITALKQFTWPSSRFGLGEVTLPID